jgi:hypothetical protein
MVIVVIVIALLALYKSAETGEFKKKVVDRPPREFTELKLKQQGELNAYKWVDRAAGVAAIPIDRAMDIVVRENQGAFGGPGVAPQTPEKPEAQTRESDGTDKASRAGVAAPQISDSQSAPMPEGGASNE